MKKFLLCYAVLTTALLACACRSCRHARGESRRLADNQTALASEVERYRTRLGEEAASVQALRLRCAEFEELRAADAARIRQLGIRLRRVEAAAKSSTQTAVVLRAAVRFATVRSFRWRDPWVTVEGSIGCDSVECRIRSVDTLRQVVHRVPRRFLFIRWGTKALRQQIVSSNPHTRIVYTEYVRIER